MQPCRSKAKVNLTKLNKVLKSLTRPKKRRKRSGKQRSKIKKQPLRKVTLRLQDRILFLIEKKRLVKI